MRHFSSPPAMPTTRQSCTFAICPTMDPTAPAAADTTTVSPRSSAPTSRRPKYAVMPVMPSAPRYTGSAAATLNAPAPSETTYSWTPNIPVRWSPGAKSGWLEATTSTSEPARMTPPIPTGRT
jgi:hypothetical protein